MKCSECVAQDLRSTISILGSSQTLMGGGNPYYDENGIYHRHNPNQRSEGFRCSRGHIWEIKSYIPCPAGDYPSK